jgi:hypothetical protein
VDVVADAGAVDSLVVAAVDLDQVYKKTAFSSSLTVRQNRLERLSIAKFFANLMSTYRVRLCLALTVSIWSLPSA